MTFRVLYVENRDTDYDKLESALSETGDPPDQESVELSRAESPLAATGRLREDFDLILADVYFPNSRGRDADQLATLIEEIRRYRQRPGRRRAAPVIVYTLHSRASLTNLLQHRGLLYDVWDKTTAVPAYAAWRIRRVAQELASQRPIRVLLRAIEAHAPTTGWHAHVVSMAQRYADEINEWVQLKECTAAVEAIGHDIGAGTSMKDLWGVLVGWEPISRAIRESTRGHARHLLNVFWMGYVLLNHRTLSSWVHATWDYLKHDRGDMHAVATIDSAEALSRAWYFGGLFHDLGGALEKSADAVKAINTLLCKFPDYARLPSVRPEFSPQLSLDVGSLLREYRLPLATALAAIWKDSYDDGHPDQGVVTAVTLRRLLEGSPAHPFAREGARAAAIHNAAPRLAPANAKLPLSWTDEPLGCLLALCDQLQTWDRQRGDEGKDKKRVLPADAELTQLDVETVSGRPTVAVGINYLPPPVVLRNEELLKDCHDDLGAVLDEFPLSTLRRIEGPWPFDVHLTFTVAGRSLRRARLPSSA